MAKRQLTIGMSLLCVALIIAGCGGGEAESDRGNTVLAPKKAATEAVPEIKEPTEQASAPVVESAAKETAAATPTPEAAKPEMQANPAGDQVAAAPAAAKSKTAPAAKEAATKATAAKGTTFKGRVVVKGNAPKREEIKPSGNDAYCIEVGAIQGTEVIVGEGGGLADVFVWVRKVPKGLELPEVDAEPVVLDQKGCMFKPPAIICQVGQTLLVKNDDATLHNTRMSGFAVNFNQTVAPNNREGVAVEFKRPESVPVPVKCDIHGWMSARILVTATPWSTLTDKDGYFEINNLPADTVLEFRVQHGRAGYVQKSLKLTFKEGEEIEKTFEVDALDLVAQ